MPRREASAHPSGRGVTGSRRAARERRQRDRRDRRGWYLLSHQWVLLALAVVAVAFTWAGVHWPDVVPPSSLVVVVLVGGLLLSLRNLALLYAVVAAALVFDIVAVPGTRPGVMGVVVVAAALIFVLARSRAPLGVSATLGESMLIDLRDRLRQQGELPPLPPGWQAEVVLRPAGGASFSGDFLVATRSDDGHVLEAALVDVSGKGQAAGTRALLLSGAFGGLLGSLPPCEFLQAANRYLLRQHWPEGFATAAHVSLELRTGDYQVTSAGHPPPAQFLAGSGRWALADQARGPLLGVIPDPEFTAQHGRLERGDALLLYTDGLIETPGRDIDEGIDRLLGEAERLVTRGFRDGARWLIDAVNQGDSDDRALVMIWRT